MPAARRISVVVDADSAPLQVAVDKASAALVEMGDVLKGQAQEALAAGQRTISSNQEVAASYERTGGAVQGSVLEVVKSLRTQIQEQTRVAESAASSTSGVVDANARAAESAKARAAEVQGASREEVAAHRASGAAAASSAKAFGASGSTLVGWGKKVALTAAGVAGASVYMAAKFEESTLKLHTQAGATTAQMDKLRKGMLAMAGSVGQTPMALEAGMYHVVSSMNALLPKATRVNEELHVLKIASEGAAIGGTNLEETSYALASAMNALHLHAGDAEKAMGNLNAIVGAGDMTMNDLLDSLKSGVLPTAQAFGTNLQSVGAALAVFGDEGIRGAEAGTKLRMMFALLGGPTGKSVEILKSIGVSAGDMKAKFAGMQTALEAAGVSTTKMSEDLKQPNGIYVALRDLKTHLEASGLSATASAAVISRAFGGGRTGAGIMMLVQNLERLDSKYHQIGKTTGTFHQDWEATQKTLAFQAKQLGAEAEALGIRFGEKLIPVAREGIGTFKEVAHWLHEGSMEAKALEGVVAGGLTLAVGAFTVNKLAKMISGLKEAGSLVSGGKLFSGGGSRGTGTVSGMPSVRGATPADPVWVKEVGGPHSGPFVPPGTPPIPGRGGSVPDEIPKLGKLVSDHPLASAGGLATVIAAFAAGGKPGVTQTPGNIVNAQAHGAGHFLEGGPKAVLAMLGIKTPSITDALLPGVNHLGFDPMKDPQAAVNYILTGQKPKAGNSVADTPQKRKFIDSPSMGHPQASPAGVHPHDEPNRHEPGLTQHQENTVPFLKARKDLASANAQLATSQERLNGLGEAGKQHTPEYTRAVQELTEAQKAQKRAQGEVLAAAPALEAAWRKAPDGINTAARAYAAFPEIVKRYLHNAKEGMTSELTGIAQQTGPLSAKAVAHVVAQYNSLPPKLKAELDAAGGAVKQGLEKINAETTLELKVLGVAGGITGEVGKAVSKIHLARGGLMQLGRPGEPGRDSIPMSVGGHNIVAAPGEQVAVFTRHQQADVASKIPGGLPSVFANKTPNYMAQGGLVVKGPVSTFGPPGEPAGGTAYGSSSSQPGIAVNPHGGGAWNDALARSLAGHIAKVIIAGHQANLKVIDKGPSASGAHGARVIDVTGAGAAAMGLPQANFPTDAVGEAVFGDAVGAATIGGGAGGGSRGIKTPAWKGSGGIIGQIGKAALAIAAKAANQKLSSLAPSGGSTASGAPAAVGPASGPAGLGSFDGRSVAQWIVPELQYAQAHGWKGSITSGYRPPGQVVSGPVVAPQGHSEHQGTQYPSGAVDFGGPFDAAGKANREAFERATAGYQGHKLIPATGFRDDGHMSATGHSEGGFVNAAMGWLMAATGASVTAASKKAAAHKKVPDKHHKSPAHRKTLKQSLAAALAPLSTIPDTETLGSEFDKRSKALEAMQGQASMLQSLESTGKQDTFILPGDMSYIGAMSKYANVQPGMTTAAASILNEQAQNRNKLATKGKASVGQEEEAEALSYQAEYIAWAASQASHRKLTPSDMGILGGVSSLVGWTPKPGSNLWEAELVNMKLQQGALGGEQHFAQGGLSQIAVAIAERAKREKLVQSVMEQENARLELTKGHAEELAKGSLKHKIALAQDQERYSARLHGAQKSAASIQEAIDHEHEAAKPDKQLLAHLEHQKHEVTTAAKQGKPASGKVGAAQVKLLEHELKGQLPEIEDALSKLGGKRTGISHAGGQYGKLVSETKTLRKAGTSTFQSALDKIASSDLPTAALNIRSIEEAAQDSPVPIFVPGTHEGSENTDSTLLALQKQLSQQLAETVTLQGAQLKTFQNFIPQIPHYEKGGPVVSDGLIYAHKGEHVVPAGGTLAVNSSAPNVETNVHVHGELAPLLRIIDERVRHPDNVRAVSGQMARRTQGFAGRT